MHIEQTEGQYPAKPARIVRQRWTERHEDELAERWFSLQSHHGIARDMGWSPSAVASKAHFLQLPQRFGMSLHDDYLPERRGEYARFFQGWRRIKCRHRSRLFWTNARGILYSDLAWKQGGLQARMQDGSDYALGALVDGAGGFGAAF